MWFQPFQVQNVVSTWVVETTPEWLKPHFWRNVVSTCGFNHVVSILLFMLFFYFIIVFIITKQKWENLNVENANSEERYGTPHCLKHTVALAKRIHVWLLNFDFL